MPIRFRCSFCNRLLGIATRKAGTETTCPHCGNAIVVPVPSDDGKTERINVGDVGQLLGDGATERVAEPATQVLDPAKPAVAKSSPPPLPKGAGAKVRPPAPKPAAPPAGTDERPLFEGDWDELFGQTAVPLESDQPKRPAAGGAEGMSLAQPARPITLSAPVAVLLLCGVFVLMGLSFAAGYFVAR